MYWYDAIQTFLKNFDFENLNKILQCYSVINQKNLQKLMDRYMQLGDKLEAKYVNSKFLLKAECKDVRHSLGLIKNDVQEADLALFVLKNSKIDANRFKCLNAIYGLNELIEKVQETFKLELWKTLLGWIYKICDKFCDPDQENTLYKTLMAKEINKFELRYIQMEMPSVHKRWVELTLHLFK
jgi:hypothetical protein